MAKKAVKKTEHIHRDCGFCEPIENEFLNYKGEPILGQCIWSFSLYGVTRFLLNEKVDCEKLWLNQKDK